MNPPSPSHEDIARRAHEIWTARGGPSGYDIGHWLEAERELTVAAIAALPAAEPSHTPAAPIPSPDKLAAKAAVQN